MLRRIPPVTRNLLIANIIVFVLEFLVGPNVDYMIKVFGALWTLDSGNFKVWQLITTIFMHHDFMHILFNMFALYSFGPFLESAWGDRKYFQFYMICGIVASLTYLLLTPGIGMAVGASGAIMGVLVAFAMLYPEFELMMIFIPIPIKAKYLVPIIVAIDVFSQISGSSTGIAHWAHLGGAAAGAAMVYIYRRTGARRY